MFIGGGGRSSVDAFLDSVKNKISRSLSIRSKSRRFESL